MKNKKDDPLANILITILLVVIVYYVVLCPERLIPDIEALMRLIGRQQ